jgi:N-acetylneuraminate synthase
MKRIKIGDRWVGDGEPAYIIAEIGSNFDGSMERAKMLIDLAKDCGAGVLLLIKSFRKKDLIS